MTRIWLTFIMFLSPLFGLNFCQKHDAFYEKWLEKYKIVSGNQSPPSKYKEWIHIAQELNVSYDPSDYMQIFSDLSKFKGLDLSVDYLEAFMTKINNIGRKVKGKSLKELIEISSKGGWEFGDSLLHVPHVLDPSIDFYVIHHIYDEGMSMPDENGNEIPYESMLDVFKRNRQLETIHGKNLNKVMLLQAPTSFTAVPYNVPIFSISRTRGFKDILFPTSRTGLPVYEYQFTAIAEPIPWEQKLNMAVFRGTTTGIDFRKVETDEIELTNNPRMKLHEMTQMQRQGTLKCPVELNFGLTQYRYLHENASDSFVEMFKKRFPLVNELDFEAQFQAKYLVVVDGNAWPDRLATFMASGSLVFLSTTQEEWTINQIKYMEHCLMVKPDLSDLIEKLEWAVKNDDEAKRIAANGRNFALEKFGMKNMQVYNALLLMEYQRLFKRS